MRKGCARRRRARFRTSGKWLVSSVFATVIMAGQTYAKEATENINTVLSPNSFTQQDKTGGDWTEVISNLPSGFTILITTRSNIVMEQDRHIVALWAPLLPGTAYSASYYVMVKSGSAGTHREAAGLIRHPDGMPIRTVRPNVPFSVPVTPVLTGIMTLDYGDDVAKAGGKSKSLQVSNSFLEQLPVPELGTMELISGGILVLTRVVRRRNSAEWTEVS